MTVRRWLTRGGVASALIALVAVPTTFIGAAPAAAATCPRVDVGYTIKDGHYIKGSGSTPNCGRVTVMLQRSRWWGWETLVSVNTTAPRSVVYHCTGTGTYTYRTYVSARTVSGNYIHKESNHLRTGC
jgi:hypothetical protein